MSVVCTGSQVQSSCHPYNREYIIIEVTVGNTKLLCLWDSGATVTLIAKHAVQKLKNYKEIPFKVKPIITISGQTVSTENTIQSSLTIGKETVIP